MRRAADAAAFASAPGVGACRWPEAELRGWVDDADERVWARVLARFEADVARELARDARV